MAPSGWPTLLQIVGQNARSGIFAHHRQDVDEKRVATIVKIGLPPVLERGHDFACFVDAKSEAKRGILGPKWGDFCARENRESGYFLDAGAIFVKMVHF